MQVLPCGEIKAVCNHCLETARHFTSIGMMNLLHNVNHSLIVSLIASTVLITQPQHIEASRELSYCTELKEERKAV